MAPILDGSKHSLRALTMIATKGVGDDQLARLLLQAYWQGSFECMDNSHVVHIHEVIKVFTWHIHETACITDSTFPSVCG